MDANLNLSIIVAMGDERVIGADGELPPWRLKADMQRFVKLTKGHMVLVGRKTHESILRKLGHQLKDRQTVVITRQSNYRSEGCVVANSWLQALQLAQGQEEVFVIGGAEIYKLALPHTNTIYLTTVLGIPAFKGAVYFPKYNQDEWEVTHRGDYDPDANNSHAYFFLTLKRRHSAKAFVNLQNARVDEQRAVMEQIEKDGVCPFCPEHLPKYHRKPILQEAKHWVVTENDWPYENTRVHLLIILKAHAEDLFGFEIQAWLELLELVQWAVQEYKITGGALGIRFGNPDMTGATVKHLHVHLIAVEITDKEDPNYKRVRFRVG